MNYSVAERYKAHRRKYPTRAATEAVAYARTDSAMYYTEGSGVGAPFVHGRTTVRWCEVPHKLGLRFVGYADKLARINHTGWYADEFQDRTMRGVVYQLPGARGRARYVYGYTTSDDILKEDYPYAAALCLTDVTVGELVGYPGDGADDDVRRQVAGWADSVAEYAADEEREYQRAWQAGARFSDTEEGVKRAEAERSELLFELRTMPKKCKRTHPQAFRALEEKLQRVREAIADGRQRMHRLIDGDDDRLSWYMDPKHVPAFMDGANLRKPHRYAGSRFRQYASGAA